MEAGAVLGACSAGSWQKAELPQQLGTVEVEREVCDLPTVEPIDVRAGRRAGLVMLPTDGAVYGGRRGAALLAACTAHTIPEKGRRFSPPSRTAMSTSTGLEVVVSDDGRRRTRGAGAPRFRHDTHLRVVPESDRAQ